MRTALLVYNPKAGRFSPELFSKQAVREFRNLGWQVELQASKSALHITELARQAVASRLDSLIIAGGDGSLGRAVTGLVGSDTALAVLPTGTANVWSQELGLPKLVPGNLASLRKTVGLLHSGRILSVDVGSCNGQFFLLWAGIGLDASVVTRTEERRRRWKKYFVVPQYLIRTIQTAMSWPAIKYRVRALSEHDSVIEKEGIFQFVIVTNVRRYAGGYLKISPQAAIDDGSMDLWLLTGDGSRDLVRSVLEIYRGRHLRSDRATQIPFREVEISMSSQTPIHIDGDSLGNLDQASIRVHHRSLKVHLPDKAFASLSSRGSHA